MTDLIPRPESGPAGGEGPAEGPTAGAQRLKALVLDTVSSEHSRRAYKKALEDFLAFLGPRPFTRASLQEFRTHMESTGLAPSSINLRLAPLRKLATEAAENGWMDPTVAAGIARVRGVRRLGLRVGKWATAEEATALLQAPDASTVKGKRDRAILAVLIGCALRRSELVGLQVSDLQQRDGRAVFVDIAGKGGRIRTVPVPDWVETALRAWLQAAGITEGRIFRAVSRWGSVTGKGLSTTAILLIVAEYAATLGLELSPHDLRRTCAKLCRISGGALEQIQFLLGHASVQTTERYLGGKQELQLAVNDKLGLGLP
jgi:site-specific recombinase XerD